MILTHTYTHFHVIDTVIHAVPLVALVFAPEAGVLHLGWACTKHLELHNKHATPPDVTSTGYFNTKAFVYSVADIFLRLTASQVERKRCTNIYRGLDGWSHSVIVVACWMQNSHKSYNSALYTELVWPLLYSFSFFFLSLHLWCNLFWVPWNYKFLLPCYGLCSSEFKTLSIWFLFLMVQRSWLV